MELTAPSPESATTMTVGQMRKSLEGLPDGAFMYSRNIDPAIPLLPIKSITQDVMDDENHTQACIIEYSETKCGCGGGCNGCEHEG